MSIFRQSFYCLMACLLTLSACAGDTTKVATNGPVPDPDNGGIKLPAGFGGQIVADKVGRVRHIFVNSNGDLYAKLEKLKDGKGIVRLRDKNGDGKFDETVGFGNFTGTGMAIKNGYLYASSNTEVFRYKLNEKDIQRGRALQEGKPEKMVDKIVEGRMQKFYEEVCLYEQPFIRENSTTVGDLIKAMIAKVGENISVSRFVRFKVGEAALIEETADQSPPKE